MPKKIAFASILTAVLGLYAEYLSALMMPGPDWKMYAGSLFQLLDLAFSMRRGLFGVGNHNYINIAFYLILLSGGILILINGTGTRLVRFVFSIIFFGHIAGLVITLTVVISKVMQPSEDFKWFIFLCFLVWRLLWAWVCFRILKYYRDTMTPAVQQPHNHLIEATRWQRFFHHTVDLLTALLIFFPLMMRLLRKEAVRDFLAPLNDVAEGRLGLYLITIFFLTIYYMFFECLLQATPGKLLSGTRVITDDGDRPAFMRILKRTLIRFVPFEAFSLLVGWAWHDSWSHTSVVREERKSKAKKIENDAEND